MSGVGPLEFSNITADFDFRAKARRGNRFKQAGAAAMSSIARIIAISVMTLAAVRSSAAQQQSFPQQSFPQQGQPHQANVCYSNGAAFSPGSKHNCTYQTCSTIYPYTCAAREYDVCATNGTWQHSGESWGKPAAGC